VKRIETRYVCQTCAMEAPRWEGQCRSCGAWNSLVETPVTALPRAARRGATSRSSLQAIPLRDVAPGSASRLQLGIGELDRVLGGGVVAGSMVLLAGEPGVGKSTLALGAAAAAADRLDRPVLYVSGEESPGQLQLRADRLGHLVGTAAERLHVLGANEVESVVEAARRLRPTIVIVDSIQSLTADDLDGPAGSVGQVRETAQRLLLYAKGEGVPVVVVGHVTKDGSVAGPKTLEHIVDVVLALEGEPGGAVRLLRATKNRFGSTEEVGLFEMSGDGLRPMPDPAELFTPAGEARPPGSAVAMLLEGSRPLLVEVQALVGGGGYGPPRRAASGVDLDRLAVLTAVLAKRAGVGIGSHDVYVSLAGGLRSREPAIDLPLALALASSIRDRPIASGTVTGAEVALSGELRPIPGLERRLREAARLGYRRAIVAASLRPGPEQRPGRTAAPFGPSELDGLRVVAVPTLRAALDVALERPASSPERLTAVPVESGSQG